jgi:hypothetical protein
VCADLDALITARDVTVDDLLPPRRGPGRRPATSDAELICLAVLQVLLGYPSERHFLRYAHPHLRGLFPTLPGQSGYNRRLRRLAPACSWSCTISRSPRRLGVTRSVCWTPPRSPALPPARP